MALKLRPRHRREEHSSLVDKHIEILKQWEQTVLVEAPTDRDIRISELLHPRSVTVKQESETVN
jgi:hypothetical protein